MKREIVSQKDLARRLSQLKDFSRPQAKEEQYSVSGDVAALMLWQAYLLDDIHQKVIADLGSGPGRLGIGALHLGAKSVFFVEKDANAVEDLQKNIASQSQSHFGTIQIIDDDVSHFGTEVDTVIMNPPFGIQRLHADRIFMEKAMRVSTTIWSLHDSHGVDFIIELAKQSGFTLTHRIPTLLRLPATMTFHLKKAKMAEVTWLRFEG